MSWYSLQYIVYIQPLSISVLDIDECGSMPCLMGQCIDSINGYVCICDPGWTGVMCETSKFLIFFFFWRWMLL